MTYLDDLLTFKGEAPLPARAPRESEEIVRPKGFLKREKRKLVEEPSDYRVYETVAGYPIVLRTFGSGELVSDYSSIDKEKHSPQLDKELKLHQQDLKFSNLFFNYLTQTGYLFRKVLMDPQNHPDLIDNPDLVDEYLSTFFYTVDKQGRLSEFGLHLGTVNDCDDPGYRFRVTRSYFSQQPTVSLASIPADLLTLDPKLKAKLNWEIDPASTIENFAKIMSKEVITPEDMGYILKLDYVAVHRGKREERARINQDFADRLFGKKSR